MNGLVAGEKRKKVEKWENIDKRGASDEKGQKERDK